jgi:hypothetical protein
MLLLLFALRVAKFVNFDAKSYMFVWNILPKITLPLYNMNTSSTARCSVGLYISQNLLFSVSKSFVFSKVCRSLGRQGSDSCQCFQNEGTEEGGRSDHMPSHLNKMQCSIVPLWTNNL